jgi:hypothetical protein
VVSFNRVILAGNLTRDPELRFTNDGVPVCSFGLAVNRVRSRNEEVDFFDVSAWRASSTAPGRRRTAPSGARWTWSPTTSSSSGAPATLMTAVPLPGEAAGAEVGARAATATR